MSQRENGSRVIDIRDGLRYVAVLGYPKMFVLDPANWPQKKKRAPRRRS